ncbi:MAG TPA: DUF6691 family protein [Rhodothermales bacterium]|nr:DUF6691 family protein [Rhodothermales bacterium]
MSTHIENALHEASLFIEPVECLDTEQVVAPLKEKALREGNAPVSLLVYGLLGLFFGVLLVKSEVVSWFRIQEMFRFDSFHLYGIIGSAVVVAAISLQLIKRMDLTTIHGEPIEIQPKAWSHLGTRYWLGGILFGLGWALLGACPGPIFALLGSGVTVMIVALLSALAGTWVYAALRPKLPH